MPILNVFLLQSLPDDVPMYELKDYLEMVIRTNLADQHERKIMMGLLQAEATRLQVAVDTEKKKCFELNEATVCPECKKRFANQTAFVRYPNGQVVHLSCYDRCLEASQQ